VAVGDRGFQSPPRQRCAVHTKFNSAFHPSVIGYWMVAYVNFTKLTVHFDERSGPPPKHMPTVTGSRAGRQTSQTYSQSHS